MLQRANVAKTRDEMNERDERGTRKCKRSRNRIISSTAASAREYQVRLQKSLRPEALLVFVSILSIFICRAYSHIMNSIHPCVRKPVALYKQFICSVSFISISLYLHAFFF